jgi:plastocyanin
MSNPLRILLLVTFMLFALAVAACGGDDNAASSSATAARTSSPTATAKASASATPTAVATATPAATASPAPTNSPAPTAQPTSSAPSTIVEGNFTISYNGVVNPTITVGTGAVTFQVQNTDTDGHNIHVADADGIFDEQFCHPNDGVDLACSDPPLIPQGTTATLTVNFPAPGTYIFHCDFHPSLMKGTFTVQ